MLEENQGKLNCAEIATTSGTAEKVRTETDSLGDQEINLCSQSVLSRN